MAKKRAKKESAQKADSLNPSSTKDILSFMEGFTKEFNAENKDVKAITGDSEELDSLVSGFIPTGCPNFDNMLGGGFPRGRVVQLYGNESCFKSGATYSAMINCYKMGGLSFLIDTECSFDPERFIRMGGNPKAVGLFQKQEGDKNKEKKKGKKKPTNDEPIMSVQDVFRYFEKIFTKLSTSEMRDVPVIAVLDSLDNLTTDEALQGNKTGMTLKPREIREGFRKITSQIGRYKISFVIVSQTIENIGGYGSAQTTAGGGGPKFISSVRVNMKKFYYGDGDKYTKNSDNGPTGNLLVQSTVTKSKINRPWMSSVTAVNNDSSQYFEGVDPVFSLYYGLGDMVLKSAGSYKALTPIVCGDATKAFSDAHPEFMSMDLKFYQSQWRKVTTENPLIVDYMNALSKDVFFRPGIFNPSVTSDVSEVEETYEEDEESVEPDSDDFEQEPEEKDLTPDE